MREESGEVAATSAPHAGNAPRLLLIGGGREGQEMMEDAASLGIRLLNINNHGGFKQGFLPFVEQAFIADYSNASLIIPVAKALHGAMPVDAVISLTEDGLVPASWVNEALGMAGESVATVEAFKDKVIMRRRLADAGVSPVQFCQLEGEEDALAFLGSHGASIIKPADGAGSRGIYLVSTAQDVRDAMDALGTAGASRLLMEEFLSGQEISVEAFSFDGTHHILAMTDKMTNARFVEIGHRMPSVLDGAAKEDVAELVLRFLDVMGLRNGPTHTEIKLTSRGPRIIESHNRVGGDRINELVKCCFGFSLKGLAMAWACRQVSAWTQAPLPTAYAEIAFLLPPVGRVACIEGVDAAMAVPGSVEVRIDVAVGDCISTVASSRDRAGHVIAQGTSREEARARVEKMASRVSIQTIQEE
ncbi:hypothetical protein XBLMG947_3680 [Xanthomonas bromi]|uniref:ATP-grasp domain-containing protein n=1 Tax=Xanthomonas bromi TaxID=56449 RepID=A0A1C3NR60_9XANT|nr:ATP-grasp domain-containing protein [Xanthomonas bromi]PPV05194.1 hypothetical protein XbrCFBP1976_18380 [Xanthomonas bromi]SBV52879.1 hypothetical protein XBLMG947_3680 [Xanthomonas bromi]